VSPGTAVTIPSPGVVIGPVNINDGPAAQAMVDVNSIYSTLIGVTEQCCNSNTSPNIGNQQVLLAGAYCFDSSINVVGTLYLDAQGQSDATFMFFTPDALNTAAGSNIALMNAGSGCNVYWVVGFSASLGASSTFTGNLIAGVDIFVGSNSIIRGRLFARTGVVTLNSDMVANSTCITCPPLQMHELGATSSASTSDFVLSTILASLIASVMIVGMDLIA